MNNKKVEDNVAEVLKQDYENAKSDQPQARDLGEVLDAIRDASFADMKRVCPHKRMYGKELNRVLRDTFGYDYFQTNFDSGYLEDCVDEELLVFVINGDQKEKFNEFVKTHKCKYTSNPLNAGAISSNFGFFFRPTSLGMVTKVKCNCGAEEDITDAENW